MRNLLPLVGVLLVAGCGPQAFSAHARDNDASDIRRALTLSKEPAAGPSNGTGHPMAFAVTAGQPKELAGIDLSTGAVVWKVPADVRSRVEVGRGLVAHRQGERAIVGRDPSTGAQKLSVQIGANELLMGLAVDDEHLYYVVQTTGDRRVSYTVGVDRAGHELWRTPAQGTLGAPAARGGLVAVPFAHQNVSLLDGNTGHEIARVRATDESIGFVRAARGGLFYGGGKGVYLLDDKSANGDRARSSYLEAKLVSDQMRPMYSWDGYKPEQSDYSAFDRNRLLWRAQKTDHGVAFEHDLAVLHSFRFLFGFDARDGKLRWAYANPRNDLVGTEDVGSAIVYATIDGDVGALDEATGTPHALAKTGLRFAGVTIDAEGLNVPQGASGDADLALRQNLERIIWDPDARFTSVKIFATAALGDVPGIETTQALVKIVRAQSGVPRSAQRTAGDALMKRKDPAGGPILADALKLHTDWLLDQRAVGVDILARAAAEIAYKPVVPLIASHLADPETPQASLKDLVVALGTLGGKDASRSLRTFLLTYRADPMFVQDPSPLVAAGTALIGLGAEERRGVVFVAEEKRTLPPVAEALKAALAAPASTKK